MRHQGRQPVDGVSLTLNAFAGVSCLLSVSLTVPTSFSVQRTKTHMVLGLYNYRKVNNKLKLQAALNGPSCLRARRAAAQSKGFCHGHVDVFRPGLFSDSARRR